ncbi:MAG: LamG-like jellyroll fold domain-containing protein, partial [Verrucomicrobiales bacterium]
MTASAMAQRVSKGLIVLYDFSDPSGETIGDRSGLEPAMDLHIAEPDKVRRSEGALEIRSATIIRSKTTPPRITRAVKRSGAVTVEAWIKPANLRQSGPARIITLSKDSVNRNVTLGQDGDRVDARLRTEETGNNGVPSLPSASRSLEARTTHVAFTRDRAGRAQIYIDGKRSSEKKLAGSISNWDSSMKFALANEFSNDRPWLGSYYLVALYDRALTAEEIAANAGAGPGAAAAPSIAKRDPSEVLFETKIAAILADHCLECHDSATRKGKLDLSHRQTAFAGGRDGSPITPGNSGESLLWESVASDEMPEDRPPLTDEDKAALRQWID